MSRTSTTQHNNSAVTGIKTARSIVERANHEATAPRAGFPDTMKYILGLSEFVLYSQFNKADILAAVNISQ